ncbi:hypothetical protein BJ875DRAFT_66171 [Amylocarpus encephaloides]|uniref:Uncharacterized protein n=1 Tax=Amylocarpus encephaloides TaxID=45428 RepID=A0A9P7YGZ5_9HELO|nr:hypothetical protein BJ875DRAFT_66171 [Amylocarpus encephaloides]
MSGGSILITGANGGLGTAFVTELLRSSHGAECYGIFTVRNPEGASNIHRILEEASALHKHELFPLDLISLDSIRSSARTLNQRVATGHVPRIRALVLSAAVQHVDGTKSTGDGFESHFAVNYLANFLFVLLILQSMDKEHGRIIMISTAMHDSTHWMNKGTWPVGMKEMYTTTERVSRGGGLGNEVGCLGEIIGMRQYGASKMFLVMFAYELQRRLDQDSTLSKISVLSMDPGGMGGAELTKRGSPISRFIWSHIMPTVQNASVYIWSNGVLRTHEKSARDLLRACFDRKDLGEHPKAMFLNGSAQSMSSDESRDEKNQRRLWTESLVLVGLEDGQTMLENWR